MSKDEALKLALEALEVDAYVYNGEKSWKAITAIKEALAQPEHEPLCTAAMFDDAFLVKSGLSPDTKLYTTPPQHTWVGLTAEELNEAMEYWSDDERSAYGGAYAAEGEYFDVKTSWRYIEAKLKEKNT